MEIGDIVEVPDSGLRRPTPGIIVNIQTLEARNKKEYFVATEFDITWYGGATPIPSDQTTLEKMIKEFPEPNCLVAKKEDMPEWAIEVPEYDPGIWDSIGWGKFFDHVSQENRQLG